MNMLAKRYIVERACAAHCTYQGSNKDWVGVLVHVVDGEADPPLDETPDARTWMFLSAYGKSGAHLQGGEIAPLMTRREAEKAFETKVKEKLRKHHYDEEDFAPFLSAFQVPLVMAGTQRSGAHATMRGTGQQRGEHVVEQTGEQALSPARLDYESNRADAISSWQAYASASYGATEKANGERCLLAYDEQRGMQAFNRNGNALRTIPPDAHALTALTPLATSFILDGERLVGEQEGQYAVFDVLRWKGEDIRSWPYHVRMITLREAFKQAHLIKEEIPTPTLGKALQNSLITGLMLLTPVRGTENIARVVNVVRRRAGEGVIIRQLAASYMSPKAVLKYKFTADIDAVVIGIKPGAAGGSLILGLRRSSDNAVIACGHVRSGLTNQDIAFFADQLAQGFWPVVTVKYRLGRTSGIALGEPSTGRTYLRHDKDPWSCTTDQLGKEKADLIACAPSIPEIAFPHHVYTS